VTDRPPSRLHLRLPFRAFPPAVLEVSGEFPVTSAEWDTVMAVLASMRPVLTAGEAG
jgi:hypothetical protein